MTIRQVHIQLTVALDDSDGGVAVAYDLSSNIKTHATDEDIALIISRLKDEQHYRMIQRVISECYTKGDKSDVGIME